MKVKDITIPKGKLEDFIGICNRIVTDGDCQNVICHECLFHDTGLCSIPFARAKEFLEIHKEKK